MFTINSPGRIKDIEQIQDLPITTKQDLRDNFPYGFLTLEMKDVAGGHDDNQVSGRR